MITIHIITHNIRTNVDTVEECSYFAFGVRVWDHFTCIRISQL